MTTKALRKQLVAAIAMVLVAAVALGSSTYAWFAMNTQVTATGMQVKAAAEDGLLIHNELDGDAAANWLVSKNASYGALVALTPTSTVDASAWYHNKSNDPNNYAGVEAYETLSTNANWKRDAGDTKTGVYYIDSSTNVGTKDDNERAYVLLNKFYLKSSGDAINLASGSAYEHLYINKVKVTGSTSSTALDKALRVMVVIGGNAYIYAPFADSNVSYNVNGSSTATTATAVTDTTNYIVNTVVTGVTGNGAIPAYTTALASTVEADVYVYFEGEDQNCKSANIVENLDTLNVEVVFGLTTVSAPAAP